MLSNTIQRFTALFEEGTKATACDCLTFDDRVVFLVAVGDMATAIGPGGWTVQSIERQLDRTVESVGNADTPGAFVVGALAPAAIRYVTFSRQNDTIVYAEVAEADRGVAISASGKTIDTTRESACRHYNIDDIQST